MIKVGIWTESVYELVRFFKIFDATYIVFINIKEIKIL